LLCGLAVTIKMPTMHTDPDPQRSIIPHDHKVHDKSKDKGPATLREFFWALNALALQGFGGVITAAHRVIVEQYRWLTPTQFAQAWAVAQVMPGPNIVNLCANLGLQYFGTRGVLVAVAGLLAVPFVLTTTLAALYSQFAHLAWVAGAVHGMSAVAAGLIIASGLRLAHTLPQHVLGMAWVSVLAVSAFVLVGVLRWNLTGVLLGVGLLACTLTWFKLARARDD
jgi:chromate transporter